MLKKSLLLRFFNFWPPFLGAGIRIAHVARDFRAIDVEMKLKLWNRNYVGTHFGGSLYAMTDPFFMVMLIENLGPNYIVWDKAAVIRFKKPGRGKVRASFRLSYEQIESARQEADRNTKYEPLYLINIVDDAGDTIAEVEKTLYIKRKDRSHHSSL